MKKGTMFGGVDVFETVLLPLVKPDDLVRSSVLEFVAVLLPTKIPDLGPPN